MRANTDRLLKVLSYAVLSIAAFVISAPWGMLRFWNRNPTTVLAVLPSSFFPRSRSSSRS